MKALASVRSCHQKSSKEEGEDACCNFQKKAEVSRGIVASSEATRKRGERKQNTIIDRKKRKEKNLLRTFTPF